MRLCPYCRMPIPERNAMTDPRLLGTLNMINRSLESIAASLALIAAKVDAATMSVEVTPAQEEKP